MAEPKIPPHSLEAEQSVLGAILIDKDAIVEVAGFLHPEHFYEQRHQEIFSAMLSLYEERKPIDLLTLTEQLKAGKKYKDVGGAGYLTELTGVVPTSAHVENYGQMIRELYAKRELISASANVTEMAFDPGKNLSELLDRAESKIFSISQENLARNFVSIKDVLAQSFDRLDEIQKRGGGLRGVPTGFRDLDNVLAGLQDSNLLILAARPGVGKTAFLLNVLLHVAVREKLPTAIFSLEMSVEELVDRLLVMQSGVDAWRLKTGRLEDEDFDQLQEAMGLLADAPIYFDDTPGLSIMEMRTKARRQQLEHGLKLLLVDYLQLMDSGRHYDNRVQEVSIISQSLKNLARELRVPVLAASQLNRQVEARGTKKPQLADLRESGCLCGETEILRADTGEIMAMRELVNQPPFLVFALDADLKIRVFPMVKVFSSGVKKVFRLKLKSGREIRASANHPFKTLYKWKRLDELQIGERVAVPRAIPKLADPVDPPEEKLLLLAHMIGDGCYLSRQPLHYTSGSWANITAVSEAASEAFAVTGRVVRQENWWHIYLTNSGRNPVIDWFRELGIFNQRSYQKEIPKVIFTLPTEQIAFFLRHLWATDGNLSPVSAGGMAIYYATSSPKLARQVQHLLLRLSILSRVRPTKKAGYRGGFIVDISGKVDQMKFLEEIGVFGKTKEGEKAKVRLSLLKENPNLDVVPKEIWLEIERIRRSINLSTREFHKRLNWAYSGTQRNGNGVSRRRLEHILSLLQSPLLQDLASSDIFWDEIASITPEGSEEVFDATVDGAHNFLANDIIVHNSIEQDADVVMFLYRPEESKDAAPSDKIPTTLSIDKHRNGALSEIPFMFHGSKLQFRLVAKG